MGTESGGFARDRVFPFLRRRGMMRADGAVSRRPVALTFNDEGASSWLKQP
jgi:hypothetical protein